MSENNCADNSYEKRLPNKIYNKQNYEEYNVMRENCKKNYSSIVLLSHFTSLYFFLCWSVKKDLDR
jgi:hypothetical protein